MSTSPAAPRVVAVVVAYNRAELLDEALGALRAQTRPLDEIVVIDNASTDASSAVAERHGVQLVRLERNTGGAGGFAAGLAVALDRFAADLVWLMDDDTIPTESALAELLRVREELGDEPPLLGSRVVWTDGSDHPMNMPRRRPGAGVVPRGEALGALPVRSSSFVSMLVDGRAARATTLPVADYFIWNDDFEYSLRLLRDRLGYLVPSSVVVHKTRVLGSTDADPGERFYYEVRNKLWLLRFSSGLHGRERLLYAGASARRWLRTFRRSEDRATLRRAASRGWRDGWRTRPRPNAESLGDLPVAAEVARLEGAVPR